MYCFVSNLLLFCRTVNFILSPTTLRSTNVTLPAEVDVSASDTKASDIPQTISQKDIQIFCEDLARGVKICDAGIFAAWMWETASDIKQRQVLAPCSFCWFCNSSYTNSLRQYGLHSKQWWQHG